MNNYALWPYFSPSYLQLGVEWIYLVLSLFLAYTCKDLTNFKDILVLSKCIWQSICNILQIIVFYTQNSVHLVRDPELEMP